MQWLINIINELFNDRHRYFDRGDPATFDFDKADLVTDNTWRDLDLSSIVPANAVGVVLHVKFKIGAVGTPIRFRRKGNVNLFNTSICGPSAGGVNHWDDLVCPIDSNRFLQYQIANLVWTTIEITVSAWWLE